MGSTVLPKMKKFETFCDKTAEIGGSFRTHRHTDEQTDGQTDVEVKIVI